MFKSSDLDHVNTIFRLLFDPKTVIAMDRFDGNTFDGIQQMDLRSFLRGWANWFKSSDLDHDIAMARFEGNTFEGIQQMDLRSFLRKND